MNCVCIINKNNPFEINYQVTMEAHKSRLYILFISNSMFNENHSNHTCNTVAILHACLMLLIAGPINDKC